MLQYENKSIMEQILESVPDTQLVTETRAVVISAPGQVGLQTVNLKVPGPNDVVIETQFTSISAGTERMLLAGQMPHPMLSLPVVPGYENVGTIISTGQNVDDEWLGKQVYVGGSMCYEDVNGAWGGQSATLFTDVNRVVPLNSLDPQPGLLLALAATALHGIDRLENIEGQRILILGQGPVGQIAARIAQSRGAKVIVTDRIVERLERSVGHQIINVEEQPLAEAVTEPVSAIVDATGSMAPITEALPLLASGGNILLLGFYQTLELPYAPLFLKEANLITAKEWAPGDLERCRDMMISGALKVSSLLTHCININEIERAYDTALNDPKCLKVIIDW